MSAMSELAIEVETPCTEAQKDEWRAMHAEMSTLAEGYEEALRDAGGWVLYGIEHPASRSFAQMRAKEAATLAHNLWAQRSEIHDRADWHPYTLQMKAAREATVREAAAL